MVSGADDVGQFHRSKPHALPLDNTRQPWQNVSFSPSWLQAVVVRWTNSRSGTSRVPSVDNDSRHGNHPACGWEFHQQKRPG